MIIYQGEQLAKITIKLNFSDGSKFDFTGATEITARFRTLTAGVDRTLSLAQISNVQLGQFDVSLTSANTLALLPTDSGSVLVTITKPNEKRIAVISGIRVRKP